MGWPRMDRSLMASPWPCFLARGAVLISLASFVLLAGCGNPTPTPSPTPTPGPAQVRDRAAGEMRSLSSAHFTVSHEEGGTDLGFGLLTEAEGDGLFPNRATFVAKAVAKQFGGITLEFNIVQVGPDTYLQDRISNRWQVLPPGTLLISFAAVNDAIADALASITDAALSDGGSIDGVSTRLLAGTVDASALRGLVPTAPAGSALDLRVWVGRDDFLVRKVSMTGVLLDGDPPSITRILELSSFNNPVTVEPPI